MKKVLLSLAAVALVSIAFTSCNKSCTCSTTIAGVTSTAEVSAVDNSNDCEAMNQVTQYGSINCSWE